MKFDVIIATYKRSESLYILVSQILECSLLPGNIIVVDSSPSEDYQIQTLDRVVYVRSSHGNQPYQRYVGYLKAKNEILFYFDDDMRVLDSQCFEKLIPLYLDKCVVGIQPNFTSKHDFFDNKIPKSKIKQVENNQGGVLKFLKLLSGYPIIKEGKFWLAGIKGARPQHLQTVEWFYGPVFSARKKPLFKNFNFRLFEIFEEKVGMGEDAIIGFTLSKEGSILYFEEELFHHQDQSDSTYSSDFESYGKRVAFSRLYLSDEYARLTEKSKWGVFFHFNWYMFWRLWGMGLNQMINPAPARIQMFRGYVAGWLLAIRKQASLATMDKGEYWIKEAENDSKQ